MDKLLAVADSEKTLSWLCDNPSLLKSLKAMLCHYLCVSKLIFISTKLITKGKVYFTFFTRFFIDMLHLTVTKC